MAEENPVLSLSSWFEFKVSNEETGCGIRGAGNSCRSLELILHCVVVGHGAICNGARGLLSFATGAFESTFFAVV